MQHINFQLIFHTDNHINGYQLSQELPQSVILNNQTFTLKILATLEIVRQLQPFIVIVVVIVNQQVNFLYLNCYVKK